MLNVTYMIRDIWADWVVCLNSVVLNIGGLAVPSFWLIAGLCLTGLVIRGFWKGA